MRKGRLLKNDGGEECKFGFYEKVPDEPAVKKGANRQRSKASSRLNRQILNFMETEHGKIAKGRALTIGDSRRRGGGIRRL